MNSQADNDDNSPMARLKKIGFEPVGDWILLEDKISIKCSKHERAVNVLYAFVVNEEPVYIGKTTLRLGQRMQQYRTPGHLQRTNLRNRESILGELKNGKKVTLYVLPDNGLMHYGNFHINLAAGLEDSLIKQLKPSWNGGRKEPDPSPETVR